MSNTNKNKIVTRKCLVTKELYPLNDLIRVALVNKNEVFVDIDQKLGGRGCYVYKKLSAEQKKTIIGKRIFNRAFKINVPNEIYLEVLEILEGGAQDEK